MSGGRSWPVWLVALAAVAVLLTAERWPGWWAWSFLGYVPWPLRLAGAGFVMGAAWIGCVEVKPPKHNRGHRPIWPAWLLLPSVAALFWLLRERTYRGDALLKLHLLETHSLQTDPYVWKEPLDTFLAYTLSRNLPADAAVAGLSVLAGVIYVAAALTLRRFLGLTYWGQVAVVVGLLALGSTQLWFGHVENYSLVTAASLVTVAAALRWLDAQEDRNGWLQERWLLVVGLAAGCAVSLHPQASFILPGLLALPRPGHWWRQLALLTGAGLIPPSLTVVILRASGVPWPNLTQGFAGDPQLFWTPIQAFAPSRLLDALNNLWLVAPLAPLLLSAGIAGLLWPPMRRDRRFRYLSALAGSWLLYHFFFQNDLPRPKDWDLFAIVGPGLTLWGLYAWLHITGFGRTSQSEGHRCGILAPALAFALVNTTAWVGVNHAHILLEPDPDQRWLYARYRLTELTELLPLATITPLEPICRDPMADPTGCQRVTVTSFMMPQDGDGRPVIFAHAPAQISFPLALPGESLFLWLSPALDPLAWGWGGDGVTFQVRVRSHDGDELLWARHLTPAKPQDRDWLEVFLSLHRWQGRNIELVLETLPGPANDSSADRAGWGLAWLMRGTVADRSR